MHLSASRDIRRYKLDVQLLGAYSGVGRLPVGKWAHWVHDCWVMSVLHHGQMMQRIRRGRPFTYAGGAAYLYAPRIEYGELHALEFRKSSYVYFNLSGQTQREFRWLVGRAGYWEIHDDEGLIGQRLQRMGELLMQRRPGFHLSAYGVLLDALGLLQGSQRLHAHTRIVKSVDRAHEPASLTGQIEQYVRQHIGETIGTEDLASHVGMSVSRLAHAYPKL